MLEVNATPRSPAEQSAHQQPAMVRSPSPSGKHQAVDGAPSMTIRNERRIKQLNDVIDASIAVEKQKVMEKKEREKAKTRALKAKASRLAEKKRKQVLKGVSKKSKKVLPVKQKKVRAKPKAAAKPKALPGHQVPMEQAPAPPAPIKTTQLNMERQQMLMAKKQAKQQRVVPQKQARARR